jgi:DNA-binding transcriptional regulator of glucitol operon
MQGESRPNKLACNLGQVRARWLSGRALGLHATLLVVVAACALLGRWQLSRALGGNGLSWVYTFEWPFFGLYACYMWWKLLHEDDGDRQRRLIAKTSARAKAVVETELESLDFDPYDEEDPQLAAYNRYLASLHSADAHPPKVTKESS